MKRKNTIVRMRPDGPVVQVLPDGREVPLELSALRPMKESEVEAAARADSDARPLSQEDVRRMKRTPQAKIIRRVLALTQEEFARRYEIPLGTLRDWEQGRSEPDQPARAYLKVIARDPEGVWRTLKASEQA